MRKVNYTGVLNKKPIKAVVFIEDGLSVPSFIKHPKNSVTLKIVGKVTETDDEPSPGSFLIRNFKDSELDALAEKEAVSLMEDIAENPENYEGADNLKSLSKEHWVKEVKKSYGKLGKLVTV